jgi:hypothetical protein
MMRSPNRRRVPLGQRLLANPFLCLAILAGLAFGLILLLNLSPGDSSFAILNFVWQTLGFGFFWMGGVVDSLIPGLPEELSLALAGLCGLVLYLLADALWRRLMPFT